MKTHPTILLHTQCAVDTDHFAVEIATFNDEPGEAGIFGRIAKAFGAGHVFGKLILNLLRQALKHRGQEDARRDGHDADAGTGEFSDDVLAVPVDATSSEPARTDAR